MSWLDGEIGNLATNTRPLIASFCCRARWVRVAETVLSHLLRSETSCHWETPKTHCLKKKIETTLQGHKPMFWGELLVLHIKWSLDLSDVQFLTAMQCRCFLYNSDAMLMVFGHYYHCNTCNFFAQLLRLIVFDSFSNFRTDVWGWVFPKTSYFTTSSNSL